MEVSEPKWVNPDGLGGLHIDKLDEKDENKNIYTTIP